MKFYYDPKYKYTNRTIIDVTGDTNYKSVDYENIDSPDTINGHIIYTLGENETVPTYVVDEDNSRRYFVSGITQLRTGKFQLSLLRDIVSENPNVWKQEQAYIAAGTAPAGDYCRYKKWGLPFTNTKVGQQRLDFSGKSSFFVFYVNEQTISSDVITESDFKIGYSTLPLSNNYDIALDNLNEIPNFDFVGAGDILSWRDLKGTLFMSGWADGTGSTDSQRAYIYDSENYSDTNNVLSQVFPVKLTYPVKYLDTPIVIPSLEGNSGTFATFATAFKNYLTSYRASLGSAQLQSKIDQLDAYVNKVIRIPDANNPGQYLFYKITSTKFTWRYNETIPNASSESFTTVLSNSSAINAVSRQDKSYSNHGNGHIMFQSLFETTNYTLESLGSASTFDFTFSKDVKKLPKSAVRCVNIVSDSVISDQDLMQALMMAQANPGVDSVEGTAANIGRIIDIQYLPFSLADTTSSDFTFGAHQMKAKYLDNDDLMFTTTLTSLTNINKETDSIIITSPSRRSQFKFSPYNNDGLMVFDTKITLRPNQSIMYVRPTTQGLLLQDWDDKDCLVIQEDFSLTTVNSDWANYVYNNRNYQNAFNLQLQTKEFERGWERRIEQEQAKADEWTARNISSQKAQTYTGNLPIISSIAGAIGSAVADDQYMKMAALDREYNEALYQKSVSVAKQQFSYQIDNIKSQPLIPNTITSIDVKMLDGIYLEFYSTNQTELDSILSYYRYNGNRIDNYGTFDTYWGIFVRGKIIISYNYTQPEIDELNRRLELGIFTQEV